MDLSGKSEILITCAKGIQPFLSEEIEGLGFSVDSIHTTGVVITGSFADTYLLNLRLATAFNVLFLLDEFDCSSPDDLYLQAYNMPWEDLIDVNEYLTIVSQVNHPSIKNTMFANQKLKDAIVDRMMKKTGKRPNAWPERKNIVINLYWNRNTAWIYINTSGVKLADRGYRKIPLEAPMQETLARAVICATGYTGEEHLLNPMCGSGTLAIEAALVALKKAPGLLRSNYGFMHLKNFDKNYWQCLRKETLRSSEKKINFKIIATDYRQKAIEAAIKNARTAGVDHLIDFKVCDFRNTSIPSAPGIIILNPEYGERMGEASDLEDLYKNIGDFFKQRCTDYKGYIFTGNFDLAKKVRLKARKQTPFYNGDIECRLLAYDLY